MSPPAVEQGIWSALWRQAVLWLARYRDVSHAATDVAAWTLGLTAAMVLRFEFAWTPQGWGRFTAGGLLATVVLVGALQIIIGIAWGLYRTRWRYGSFEEVAHLTTTTALTTVIVALLNTTVLSHLVPTSVVLLGAVLALILAGGVRYTWRLLLERRLRPSGDDLSRALVFGAGEGGVQLITSMLRTPNSPYVPVGLLDDDPTKQNLQILGVDVLGGREALGGAAAQVEADTLIIAVPSADSALLRELSEQALDAALHVKVLPPIDELLGTRPGLGDIRPITEADLLGRHEIDTDLDAVSGYLTGRRVLVTGAGGSIGSELSYQISLFAPEQLVLLDRDESALHNVQLRIEGRALLDTRNLVVCDLRDEEAVADAFDEHRPEVVFHAAALKHLPLLEMYPAEALKTNVYGTQIVLEQARRHGVSRVVNISTDKAADPASVLGHSKRIAERLTAHAADQGAGTYLSVRFGNVLGSRGSVLTAFEQQILGGGPVTVTHPDTTRYFMTVEEAVQLVIQAGAVGRDGEALVLDMGDPVRIDDVARRLVAQADRPIEIVYTGLRPGEKLHEALFGEDEVDERPVHPLISHVPVTPLDIDIVRATVEGLRGDALVEALKQLALSAAPAARERR